MNSLILKSFILILLSCNNHENATLNTHSVDTPVIASKNKEEGVKPKDSSSPNLDTTINGNIILWNSHSTYSALGDLSGKLQDHPNEGSFVVFKNQQGDRYLKMVHLPGSDPNTFRFFEVGYVEPWDKKMIMLPSAIENFETETGVKLGMTISDFLKKKSKNYSKTTKRNDVILTINDTIDGLEYNAIYHFKSGKLIKFGFGYNNP